MTRALNNGVFIFILTVGFSTVCAGCVSSKPFVKLDSSGDCIVRFKNVPEDTVIFVDGRPADFVADGVVALVQGRHRLSVYVKSKEYVFFLDAIPGTFVTIEFPVRER